MENKKKLEDLEKTIKEMEAISIFLEEIDHLNLLQEDYIDFREYEDEAKGNLSVNALLTLNELRRTKKEHITLSHVIDEKIEKANELVETLLRKMYEEQNILRKEANKEENKKDTEA